MPTLDLGKVIPSINGKEPVDGNVKLNHMDVESVTQPETENDTFTDGSLSPWVNYKEELNQLKDTKANVIIDTSARAASHELHAQDGDMKFVLYGQTTETGTGDKSPANPYIISGVDVAKVHVGGKNLFNAHDYELLNAYFSSAYRLSYDANSRAIRIPICGGVRYTASVKTVLPIFRIGATSSADVPTANKSVQVWGYATMGINTSSVTVDVPIGAKYLIVQASASLFNTIVNELQIEIGNAATEFEPYNANTITIPLLPDGAPLQGNGTVYDTVENDELVDGERKCRVTRRLGKIDSYAGESVPDGYVSSTGGLDTGATIIYPLDTPKVYLADPILIRKPDMLTTNKVTVMGSVETEVQYSHDTKNYIDGLGRMLGGYTPSEFLPILELTGDTTGMSKDDAVELDYKFGAMNGKCTVKWQGSSSLTYPKKNYTIKFDTEFEAKAGWGAEKKYCAKANYIDFSHARNVCCAKLWGQIVKSRSNPPATISGLVNGGAIDGFPIGITINGQNMGLFTFNIPKDGWMYGMGNGNREAIICANNHVAATQFKGIATLNGDFELEYVSDENNSEWVMSSLNTLINSVIEATGDSLDTIVAQYLDWDSAIDYYIFTCLVQGGDMTDKNYLLYTYDGVKWGFGAYDMDSTFGLHWAGTSFYPAGDVPTFANYANIHRVMALIKTMKTDALKERYAKLRKTVLSEANLAVTFNNFTASIPKRCFDEEIKIWPTIPSTAANNLHQILNHYRMRVTIMDEEIAAL